MGWCTVGDAARELGTSPSAVRWWIDLHRLRGVRTRSGVRLISSRNLERFKREREARLAVRRLRSVGGDAR